MDMEMKDVIISITGIQNGEDGFDDSIELVTDGKFGFCKGEARLTYVESELTGLEGTTTSFNIDPFCITMERQGKLNSRMVFQEGKKHHFLYETPFGSATMGVDTHKIKTALSESGGDMEIDYVIDFDNAFVGRNSFRINVREQKRDYTPWQI